MTRRSIFTIVLLNSVGCASPTQAPIDLVITGGTVIDVPTAAFRVAGRWYDLSYRCDVDANATRVVGYAFRVCGLLPRSEWRRRKLPVR